MLKRLPDVEKEIDELDSEDEQKGWMQALESEWTQLQHREGMCNEEIRGKRMQLAELEEKIEAFDLEIEEAEFDLDECEAQRVRSHTRRRVDEIEDTERLVRAMWQSRIRKQVQRWGVCVLSLSLSLCVCLTQCIDNSSRTHTLCTGTEYGSTKERNSKTL